MQLKVTEEENGSVLRLDYELAKTSFKRVRIYITKGGWIVGDVCFRWRVCAEGFVNKCRQTHVTHQKPSSLNPQVKGLGVMPLVGDWLENKLFPSKVRFVIYMYT